MSETAFKFNSFFKCIYKAHMDFDWWSERNQNNPSFKQEPIIGFKLQVCRLTERGFLISQHSRFEGFPFHKTQSKFPCNNYETRETFKLLTCACWHMHGARVHVANLYIMRHYRRVFISPRRCCNERLMSDGYLLISWMARNYDVNNYDGPGDKDNLWCVWWKVAPVT